MIKYSKGMGISVVNLNGPVTLCYKIFSQLESAICECSLKGFYKPLSSNHKTHGKSKEWKAGYFICTYCIPLETYLFIFAVIEVICFILLH